MFLKRSVIVAAIVAALPLVSACSGGASSASAPAASKPAAGAGATLTVKGLDTMKFDPGAAPVKAGQIQVSFENTGQTLHDFTIEQGVSSKVHALAQPGKTETVTFTVDKPGTYTFFCSQPGHEAAGMKGTLTVQ